MDRAEHARDEEGNVIDSTMLPKKHQENKNINTTTKQQNNDNNIKNKLQLSDDS